MKIGNCSSTKLYKETVEAGYDYIEVPGVELAEFTEEELSLIQNDADDFWADLVDEEKGVYNEDGSINLNPNSLTVIKDCYVEPSFDDSKAGDKFQFVRNGFFCIDSKDSTKENMVFNRIVSLKSSFKIN